MTQIELASDTADLAAAGPFWAALLTGSPDSLVGDDIVDPSGRVPPLWCQGTDAHETPRERLHIDLWVPHDVAEERIAVGRRGGEWSTTRTPRRSSCRPTRRASMPVCARSSAGEALTPGAAVADLGKAVVGEHSHSRSTPGVSSPFRTRVRANVLSTKPWSSTAG